MKVLEVKLESGHEATFFLSTNLVVINTPRGVKIDDGVHNNGGWFLDKEHKYDEIISDLINGNEY